MQIGDTVHSGEGKNRVNGLVIGFMKDKPVVLWLTPVLSQHSADEWLDMTPEDRQREINNLMESL